MKFSKFKMYLFMLMVGFVFIAFDIDVETNMQYPREYENTDAVIGEFQYYNIASNYNARCTYKMLQTGSDDNNTDNGLSTQNQGAVVQQPAKVIDKIYFKNIKVDIFNDFVGFLLIAIACFGLRKVNRRFRYALLTSLCAFILHGTIAALPFFINGLFLCNAAMALGVAYLGSNVLTVFLFVSGLLKMCPDVCCRDERKWCKMIWFITFVLQILVTFVLWLGSDFQALYNLGIFCMYLLVFFIIVFWIVLYRTYDYLENSYNKAVSAK